MKVKASILVLSTILKVIQVQVDASVEKDALYDHSSLTNTRFKSVKCTSFNESLFTFNQCRVRVYSRNESAILFNTTTKVPLSDIEVTVDISMKKEMSHPYRTVINKHKVRWCGLYDKTKRQDFFTNLGLKVFQESVSQVFEKCPISKGERFAKLVLDDSKIPSFVPSARYRVDVHETSFNLNVFGVRIDIDVNKKSSF